MLRLALVPLAALVFSPYASADKFHFLSDEETAKEEVDSIPDVIVGVLTAQDEENYTIRVEGGEIQVAIDMVVKIERDNLTVADLEALEAANAPAVAQADEARQQFLAAERAESAAVRSEIIAMEAALIEAEIAAAADAVYMPGVPPALQEASYYDPIIGVVRSPLSTISDSAALLRDMFYRYQGQRTRDMARQMRQMRRYR